MFLGNGHTATTIVVMFPWQVSLHISKHRGNIVTKLSLSQQGWGWLWAFECHDLALCARLEQGLQRLLFNKLSIVNSCILAPADIRVSESMKTEYRRSQKDLEDCSSSLPSNNVGLLSQMLQYLLLTWKRYFRRSMAMSQYFIALTRFLWPDGAESISNVNHCQLEYDQNLPSISVMIPSAWGYTRSRKGSGTHTCVHALSYGSDTL